MAEVKTFMVEDAQLIFRNFAGKEDQYNREGDRNFSVILNPEVAEGMAADGWNIKYLKPREEDGDETPYIQVTVKFGVRPPKVVMITSGGRTQLGEDEIEVLDWSDFENVDMIARAYEWSVNGKTGIKAYLQSMFVTLREDELERKYARFEGEEDYQ